MKKIDYILQKERIRQAKKHIIGLSILDIGCHNGELFKNILKTKKITGDGIDNVLKEKIVTNNYTLHPGYFPQDFEISKKYNAITLLAVLEHIPINQIATYPKLFSDLLYPKGRVIITIPTKKVDSILNVLLFFKLIHGMDLEHHQDFDREEVKTIFTKNGFDLIVEKRFELGLNILYVFEKL
ncbi:methyltransferase domain-containing protein [uncultured Flavobacterium sp.]|uniref:methyltransferase domain-containing protein n=1 Tax=uncultured Flavobacterium sp. TaxID=165435 RepID=UPI0030CA3BF7